MTTTFEDFFVTINACVCANLFINDLERESPVNLCVGVLLVRHVQHVEDVSGLQHVAVLHQQ